MHPGAADGPGFLVCQQEGIVAGHEFAALAARMQAVVEAAHDPAEGTLARRHQPQFLIEGALLRVFSSECGERREGLVAVLQGNQQVGLVALPLLVVAGHARGRGEFGEAEVGRDLEREQLVLALARLEHPCARLVAIGAKGGTMVDRARTRLGVLEVPGQRGIHRVDRQVADRHAPRGRLAVVRVLHLAQVRAHGGGTGEVRIRVGYADLAHDEAVVDEAGIVVAIEVHSHRDLVVDREVAREARAVSEVLALGIAEGVAAQRERVAAEVRPPRQVADGTPEGARTVERALWAKQHFHSLEVVHAQVDVQRDLAEVGRHRATGAIAERFR